MRKIAFVAATLIVFLALNAMVVQKEALKSSGQLVYLKLNNTTTDYQYATTSFYLQYDPGSNLNGMAKGDGRIVVTLNNQNVASFVRVHADEPLTPGEHLMRYRERYGSIQIGPETYEFPKDRPQQSGSASYAEYRVNNNGDCLLIGLCDGNFARLDYWNVPGHK